MSKPRLPHLLFVEVLVGGLLAAGAVGLLLMTLQTSRSRQREEVRTREAAQVLQVELTRASVLSADAWAKREGNTQPSELGFHVRTRRLTDGGDTGCAVLVVEILDGPALRSVAKSRAHRCL